ncbi:hypothetical protein ACJX0J_015978, partial [Zea mays]
MEVHKNNRYGIFITMVFVFFLLCLGLQCDINQLSDIRIRLAIEVLEMIHLSYNFLSNNTQDSAYPAVRFHYLCLLEATIIHLMNMIERVLFWRTYDNGAGFFSGDLR